MSKGKDVLMSPPWTPHLDASQFDSISPLLLDTSGTIEVISNFAVPESPLHAPPPVHANFKRPSLHGHKRYMSFPLTSLSSKPQSTLSTHSRTMSCVTTHQGLGIAFFDDPSTSGFATASTCDSIPVSPLTEDAPTTPIKEEANEHEDSFPDAAAGKEESDHVKVERPLTAAEMRAEKRKMKRFRLTHQQTRYLMSEFARQAHPDAAHREKLSRAIPGLSSRQVQVWFQNRRAKLKRVTQDDRENIVRSRALPENFDLSSALQSPFGPPHIQTTQCLPPTSQPTSSTLERPNRSLAPATPQLHHQHRPSLSSPFTSLPAHLITSQPSPLSPTSCATFGFFAQNSFQALSESTQNSFAEQESGSLQQPSSARPPPPPSTPQSCGFASTPVQSDYETLSPGSAPYGLGFSYGNIPGFQASSIHNIRNHGKHPGKVLIPRNTSMAFSNMPETPMYSSTICSPLGIGFPIFSAPASVTSFANYIQ